MLLRAARRGLHVRRCISTRNAVIALSVISPDLATSLSTAKSLVDLDSSTSFGPLFAFQPIKKRK
jgi:hypothetical protein